MSKQHKKLGDLLVEVGMITEDQLAQALGEQKRTKRRLGDQLTEMGFATEQQILNVLEVQLKIPRLELHKEKISPAILNMVSAEMASRYQIIPVKQEGSWLILGMVDPLDYYAIDDVRLSTGFQVKPVLVKKAEMKRAIQRYYGLQKSINQMMQSFPDESIQADDVAVQQEDDSPAAVLVQQMLEHAVQAKASDIHIEPLEKETKVRFRIDGVLRTERQLPGSMHPMLTSRIKVMARLDIAEKRLPQDGRIQVDIEFRKIDLRVSILPTVFGEKVVLRILDQSEALHALDELGFAEHNLSSLKRVIRAPHGLVLVTGPTGSGKTTTLYSVLNEINDDGVNIVTVEDPVEYQLDGVNQVQVRPTIGLTFASGLRSILRQDPNVIMIGEIRDSTTAEIALRAAITGHLVFSTLHTNDAVSAVTRLIDMGIERYLVSAAIIGVVAQRLVRQVCSECAEHYELSVEEQSMFRARGLSTEQIVHSQGCSACQHTGYQGRLALHEVMVIDEHIRNLTTEGASTSAYREHLQQKGFVTLFDDGLKQVAAGRTTLSEVYRVSVES